MKRQPEDIQSDIDWIDEMLLDDMKRSHSEIQILIDRRTAFYKELEEASRVGIPSIQDVKGISIKDTKTNKISSISIKDGESKTQIRLGL